MPLSESKAGKFRLVFYLILLQITKIEPPVLFTLVNLAQSAAKANKNKNFSLEF